MDTAFLNRAGVTGSWVYVDYNFYPDKDKHSWIRRIVPFTFLQGGRDRMQGGDEYISVTGARLSFTRQGFFRVDMLFSQEPWQGREFEGVRGRMFGNVQLFRWLRPYSNINLGDAMYYDEIDPFLGKSVNVSAGALFQPNGRFSRGRRVHAHRLRSPDRPASASTPSTSSTPARPISSARSSHIRAIVQYDSQQNRVLTDFLGSYELRPGTVVYAGYGSLYEKRDYQNDDWVEGQGDYLTTRRGLFLKASYLYRFNLDEQPEASSPP